MLGRVKEEMGRPLMGRTVVALSGTEVRCRGMGGFSVWANKRIQRSRECCSGAQGSAAGGSGKRGSANGVMEKVARVSQEVPVSKGQQGKKPAPVQDIRASLIPKGPTADKADGGAGRSLVISLVRLCQRTDTQASCSPATGHDATMID
jgi:hypothetical protein